MFLTAPPSMDVLDTQSMLVEGDFTFLEVVVVAHRRSCSLNGTEVLRVCDCMPPTHAVNLKAP
jgi:hypothetical protein